MSSELMYYASSTTIQQYSNAKRNIEMNGTICCKGMVLRRA